MKSFIGEGTGVEPADNRQLPSRLWAPGSGQACRKILGFALIPNCELKFGPVHNAPGTWLHKGVSVAPRLRPFCQYSAPPSPPHCRPVGTAGGIGSTWVSLPISRAQADGEPPFSGHGGSNQTYLAELSQTAEPAGPSPAAVRRDLLGREVTSCSPSLLRMGQEEASLNYQAGFRFPTKGFLSGRGWEACPPWARHLRWTFPGVGAQHRRLEEGSPGGDAPPRLTRITSVTVPGMQVPGCRAHPEWKPLSWAWVRVVYFCFPAVRLKLYHPVLMSRQPPIKAGFGALLLFSHPSCF